MRRFIVLYIAAMGYISDMLAPGERIMLKTEISRVAQINAFISLLVMLQPMSIIRLARTELALTDRRIIGKSGGKVLALKHADVESVTVRRGLLGKFLDYGAVVVTGRNGVSVKFRSIVWPLVFQQEADEAIEVAILGRKLTEYAPLS